MKKRAPKLTAVQQALERERQSLAEELHEGLCQQLCGISIHLRVLEIRLASQAPKFSTEIEELQRNFHQAIDDIRLLYRTLKPPILDLPSFVAAVKELTQAKGGTFLHKSSLDAQDSTFLKEPAVGLFRIAQESLRDFRNLITTPTWSMRINVDETFVRMVVKIDSKSYVEIVRLGLWKRLDDVAKGMGSLDIEQNGNHVALVCKANRK